MDFHAKVFNIKSDDWWVYFKLKFIHLIKLKQKKLTWLLCVQQIDGGGSGECWTIQVKLTVEPVSMYMSGPPTIVLIGSVNK